MNDERIEEKIELRVTDETVSEAEKAPAVVVPSKAKVNQETQQAKSAATRKPMGTASRIGVGLLVFICIVASAAALIFPWTVGLVVHHYFPKAPLYAYILAGIGFLLMTAQAGLAEGGVIAAFAKQPEVTSITFLPTVCAAIHLARNLNSSRSKKMWWSCVLGLGFIGLVPPAVPAYFFTQVKTMTKVTKVLGLLSLPFIGFVLLSSSTSLLPVQLMAAMPVLRLIGPAIVFACFVSCMRDAFNRPEA